jgi:hypothetical protein
MSCCLGCSFKVLAGLCLLALPASGGVTYMRSESGSANQAVIRVQQQIARFRQGEQFQGDITPFVLAGQPNPKVLNALREALIAESVPVREQVARMLVELAERTDPLYSEGARLIRDQSIISVLINLGLAQRDVVRDYCLDALQWHAPADSLEEYGKALTDNLQRWPGSTVLLVIAKAKPAAAVPVVDHLFWSLEWQKKDSTLVARAALGDKTTEKRLVQPFLATRDPAEKARLAQLLGFIGTKSALTSLASQMRTDLVVEMPMVSRKSVRLDIMAALSYNYPDKMFLYDNAVIDDSGYARVERFCEETFGVKWETPRPPFLAVQGFPSEPPR